MHMNEVCKVLGFSQNPKGNKQARRYLANKIKYADGRLDKYDPRVRSGSRWMWRVTHIALKKICPDRFDEDQELAAELRKRLETLWAEVDKLAARIQRESQKSTDRDKVLAEAIRELRGKVASKSAA